MIADTQVARRVAGRRFPSCVAKCDLLRPLPIQTLSHDYWTFLRVSVFFDFGFGLFFFLFNLYLNSLNFNERSIGLISSAFTIGSLIGTYPAGLLTRRFGLRPLLAICLLLAPVAGCIRLLVSTQPVMLIASFFFGVSMCGWAICTPTALARLTTERNRSVGFSLNFAVGIGSGVLAGIVGGRVPALLMATFAGSTLPQVLRWTLMLACVLVAIGSLPLLRRTFLADTAPSAEPETRRFKAPSRFLFRFLICFAVWTLVAGATAPFLSLYLIRRFGFPLARVGTIFSLSQALQVAGVLLTPLLARWLGNIKTVAFTQLLTAAILVLLSRTHSPALAVPLLVCVNAGLYMAGPILYSLLMTTMPDGSRSTASAAQSITASLTIAAASAIAGSLISSTGYAALFGTTAAVSCAAAVMFLLLVRDRQTAEQTSAVPVPTPE